MGSCSSSPAALQAVSPQGAIENLTVKHDVVAAAIDVVAAVVVAEEEVKVSAPAAEEIKSQPPAEDAHSAAATAEEEEEKAAAADIDANADATTISGDGPSSPAATFAIATETSEEKGTPESQETTSSSSSAAEPAAALAASPSPARRKPFIFRFPMSASPVARRERANFVSPDDSMKSPTARLKAGVCAASPALTFNAISSSAKQEKKGFLRTYTAFSLTLVSEASEAMIVVETRYSEVERLFKLLSDPASGFPRSLLEGFSFPPKFPLSKGVVARQAIEERTASFESLFRKVCAAYQSLPADSKAKEGIDSFVFRSSE